MFRHFIKYLLNNKKRTAGAVFACVLLIVCGLFLPKNFNFSENKIITNKKYTFNHSPIIHSTQKLSGPISASFSTKNNEAIEPNKAFSLVLTIQSNIPMESAKIQWQIPEGVEHLYGHLDENISLTPGEPYIIEADFMVSENKNYQIHALVTNGDEQLSFTKAAQFNTYIYRELKNKLKNLKTTNKEYVESQKKFKTLE